MSLKYKLITKQNEAFDKETLLYYQKLNNKLREINKITPKEERESAELADVYTRVKNYVNVSRKKVQNILDQPEFLKEIHITSERSWPMYPEYIGEECGRTRYHPKKDYRVDVLVPYNRKDIKIKEVVKQAEESAMAELKAYRKARQEVAFIEKEYVSKSLAALNLPIKPKYKVYAGGGFGEGTNNYFIHLKGGTFLELNKVSKMRKIFEYKKPLTDAPHVGVEIEFVSKYDKYRLAQLLMDQSVQDFVYLTDDGSLRADGEYKYTHELAILAPEAMIHMVLERVLKAINFEDGSKVMNRCGLHVHLDMRSRDKGRCFYNLTKAQRILFAMNPRSRTDGVQADGRKDTAYSKRIDLNDLDQALRTQSQNGDRYYGINTLALPKHNTIEIRIHSGSTNFKKISNWVKILTSIVNTSERVDVEAAKPETFCNYYGLDVEMLEYIKERIAKFKDKSGKHITIDETA